MFLALHHGREPMSLDMLMYTFFRMIFEYQRNTPEYVNLLNDNIICFIPAINIDAYEESVNVYKTTGKFRPIRRNRNNQSGCELFGVDLNRNYDYYWDFNDVGSSPDPYLYNYRGPAPFSESETQAIKKFVEEYKHSLKVTVNLHS